MAVGSVDHREAENTITALNTVNAEAEAVYHAGREVLMTTDFDALNGCIYRAYNEGCTGEFIKAVDPETESIQAENRLEVMDFDESLIAVNLKVFPNPTDGLFTVDLGDLVLDEYTVQVYSMGSGMIYTDRFKEKGVNSFQLNISEYPSGIYIVKVSNNKEVFTGKIVKN